MINVCDFLGLLADDWKKVVIYDLDYDISEKMEVDDAMEKYEDCTVESFEIEHNTLCINV